MISTRVKLGALVIQYSERCGDRNVKHSDISGVNRDKEFFPSKLVGENVSNYKVVPSGYFACNLMHVGRDVVLPIAYNDSEHDVFVSPAYTVFSIRDGAPIEPRYLEMWFKSDERDRYFWMHTDSSIRDGMTFDDMCDIEIDLPPIETQKKYVDVYSAMISNQACYECGLEDLKLTCFAYIERLRKTEHLSPIGNYIEPFNEKNTDGSVTLEQGVDINKQFITPQRGNSNLSGRKIVRHGQFAYCTQLNNENVAIAYRSGDDCVVSSVYDVFGIAKKEELLPEYLMLWLIRPEFGRFVYWASEGSAYEFLNYDNLANYKIPIPPMRIQKAIGDIFNVYSSRKTMNERLKNQIKNICPILIKGSLEEANK